MLTRDGDAVDLWPRYVQVLAHLVSHPGHIFSKNDLLDLFWGDVEVTDNTIEQAIGAIRQALDGRPANARFVETVKRRGYRFVGRVEANVEPSDTRGAQSVAGAVAAITQAAPPQSDTFADWTTGRLCLESLNAEQLQQATRTFERVLAQNKNAWDAHIVLADAFFLQYECSRPECAANRALLDRAVYHAEQACALAPTSLEALSTLGLVWTAAGDYERGHGAAWRAARGAPTNWRHQFRLAMCSWGQPRLEAADRTLALLPDFPTALFISAMVWIARQRFAEAEVLVRRGAERQSLQASCNAPFPPFGLHWLDGLLHLRAGDVARARATFTREIEDSCRTSVYYREYCVNALVGLGNAHFAEDDAPAADAAFRRALEMLPCHGPALLGLQQACARSGRAADADALARRVDAITAEWMKSGRAAAAAMLAASVEATRGNAKAACDILERLLRNAPPGQVGWTIPIEPAFTAIANDRAFASVLALLSARAG